MILGLILAFASALATNLAFLFKHRGAVLAPPIRVRHPLRSAVGLFRSRWFLVGWIVAIVAWGLHVGALSLAPLSIVQAVLSGGLVFLAVSRRALLRLSARTETVGRPDDHCGGAGGDRADWRRRRGLRGSSLAALIAIEGAIFAVVAALVRVSTRRGVLARAEGLLLGAAAGALWGVSDVALKYLTQTPPGPLLGLVSPWLLTALIAGVIAFYASARSLQIGNGVEVIALTSVAANLTAILGGVLVFYDPIGSGPPEIGARFLAFCLVIAGAALMPAPMRATPGRGRGRTVRALRCRDQVPHPGATRAAAWVGQPVGADGDDRWSDLVLRIRPQPPNRRGCRGHRTHFNSRQPRRDHRRHSHLPRPDWLRPLAIAARFIAFCLVIAGAALMPAPMRAAPDAG